MLLQDLQARFLLTLQRTDVSPTQAIAYIAEGLQRVQMEVRLPSMESLVTYTATTAALISIPVPADLIEPIDVLVPATYTLPLPYLGDDSTGEVASDGQLSLKRFSFRQLQAIPLTAPAQAYARQQETFWIRGSVPIGAYVNLVYYAQMPPLVNPTDTNDLATNNPRLILYAALSLAGSDLMHPNADAWEQRYQQMLEIVTAQAEDIDASGGPAVIAPTHET